MRSWENRSDCAVTDEPLYGYYLDQTGLEHPGRDTILQSMSRSWQEVAQELCGPPPGGAELWYQKHMSHHLLPEVGREWLLQLVNCFLIRDPAAVLSSYIRSRPDVSLLDLGFVQQSSLFHWLRKQTGNTPIVLDSADILARPEPMLRALCQTLEIPFESAMMTWPAGPRDSDGVWASHWYANVQRSTGFMPPSAPKIEYPEELEPIIQAAMPHYLELYSHRIQA
jgi:hypothetical protein